MNKYFIFYCPKCNKIDIPEVPESMAIPEHIPHRGIDIGDCTGVIVKISCNENVINQLIAARD